MVFLLVLFLRIPEFQALFQRQGQSVFQDAAKAGASVGGTDLSRAHMETLAMGSGSELKADYAAKSQTIKAGSQEERQAVFGMGEESVKGMTEVDHRKTA